MDNDAGNLAVHHERRPLREAKWRYAPVRRAPPVPEDVSADDGASLGGGVWKRGGTAARTGT